MAKELTEFVLETLESHHVSRLFFTFAFMHVYPEGYNRDIARAVRNGSIVVTTNASLISTTPSAVRGAGAYTMDTARGSTHFLYINPNYTVQNQNVVNIKRNFSMQEMASLRGTIIHEATHALQDYQQNQLPPREAESIAYFAGAVTRRQWGYRSPGGISNPGVSGLAYSLYMADEFLQQPPRGQIVIPSNQILRLKSLVGTGSATRYAANGI